MALPLSFVVNERSSDYAREGDAIVVLGIDRLGRNAAEVMTTIRGLSRSGTVDTKHVSTATAWLLLRSAEGLRR